VQGKRLQSPHRPPGHSLRWAYIRSAECFGAERRGTIISPSSSCTCPETCLSASGAATLAMMHESSRLQHLSHKLHPAFWLSGYTQRHVNRGWEHFQRAQFAHMDTITGYATFMTKRLALRDANKAVTAISSSTPSLYPRARRRHTSERRSCSICITATRPIIAAVAVCIASLSLAFLTHRTPSWALGG
jgi:hypothetical protein